MVMTDRESPIVVILRYTGQSYKGGDYGNEWQTVGTQ